MGNFISHKPDGSALAKVLSLWTICVLVLAACGGSKDRANELDPVVIAEKTKTERAVSEKGPDGTEEIELTGKSELTNRTVMLDWVVAQVDTETITGREVMRIVVDGIGNANWIKLSAKERDILFDRALESIITRKLLLAEANELGYKISDAKVVSYIRSQVPEINEKFGGDIGKYAESKGVDYNEIHEQMKEYLLYTLYVQANIMSRVHVSPREIRDYYSENEDKYFEKGAVRMYAMTLYKKGDPDKDAEVLTKAEQILNDLNNGAEFEKLAMEHTEDGEKRDKGGDWGWVTSDHFASKKISQTAFDLNVGEHSDIIETNVAYWIIKTAGKKAEKTKDISEVWKEIEDRILLRKRGEEEQAEAVRLRKKFKVSLHGVSKAD